MTHMPSIINGASSMTSFCMGCERGSRMRVVGNARAFRSVSARERRADAYAARPVYGASWMVASRARAPRASQETGAARRHPGGRLAPGARGDPLPLLQFVTVTFWAIVKPLQ